MIINPVYAHGQMQRQQSSWCSSIIVKERVFVLVDRDMTWLKTLWQDSARCPCRIFAFVSRLEMVLRVLAVLGWKLQTILQQLFWCLKQGLGGKAGRIMRLYQEDVSVTWLVCQEVLSCWCWCWTSTSGDVDVDRLVVSSPLLVMRC